MPCTGAFFFDCCFGRLVPPAFLARCCSSLLWPAVQACCSGPLFLSAEIVPRDERGVRWRRFATRSKQAARRTPNRRTLPLEALAALLLLAGRRFALGRCSSRIGCFREPRSVCEGPWKDRTRVRSWCLTGRVGRVAVSLGRVLPLSSPCAGLVHPPQVGYVSTRSPCVPCNHGELSLSGPGRNKDRVSPVRFEAA